MKIKVKQKSVSPSHAHALQRRHMCIRKPVLSTAPRPAGVQAVNWSDSINSRVGGGRGQRSLGNMVHCTNKTTQHHDTVQHDSTQRSGILPWLMTEPAQTSSSAELGSFRYTSRHYKFKITLNWKQRADWITFWKMSQLHITGPFQYFSCIL